jgi:hypothetical protein
MALSGNLAAALLAVGIFGFGNLAFYVTWSGWERRPRRLRFDVVWLSFIVIWILVFFVIGAVRFGVPQALVMTAPAFAIVAIWLVLRRKLGTRARQLMVRPSGYLLEGYKLLPRYVAKPAVAVHRQRQFQELTKAGGRAVVT